MRSVLVMQFEHMHSVCIFKPFRIKTKIVCQAGIYKVFWILWVFWLVQLKPKLKIGYKCFMVDGKEYSPNESSTRLDWNLAFSSSFNESNKYMRYSDESCCWPCWNHGGMQLVWNFIGFMDTRFVRNICEKRSSKLYTNNWFGDDGSELRLRFRFVENKPRRNLKLKKKKCYNLTFYAFL